MDDRYAKSMERAERVLQQVAARSLDGAERALQNLATRTPEARAARKREQQRRNREVARRFKRVMIALAAILAVTVAIGFVHPIGPFGLLAAITAAVFATVFLSLYPKSRREVAEVGMLSNAEVVHRLDSLLIRERPALPPRALSEVDAISAQLPLLERRLETLNPLDPLAQDARRLMGQHLPDLLDRYEKVPVSHRSTRDGGGLSVEDRLLSGLGAARSAIDDIGAKLAQSDINALETQGRFIESRYKDGDVA